MEQNRILAARTLLEAQEHNIPMQARDAFHAQLYQAKRRGIDWEFTLPEWWAWWQIDGRWSTRGWKHGNGLVMCRRGDTGPYSPENVFCASISRNVREACRKKKSESAKRRFERMRQEGIAWMPNSRAVITPEGEFPSVAAAARAVGISQRGGKNRADKGIMGWGYKDVVGPTTGA